MNTSVGVEPLDWSELAVTELPTGTVTLLLGDVEGSTRLWEKRSQEMAVAIGRFNAAVSELAEAHGGVRPLEQGEGDSFVLAFARASDAVACALALQMAPLDPVKIRIGIHSGEIQLRDEANYAGPTINRTARLRDLAHGGQTVLSGATEALVVDRLPDGAWLVDMGSHVLRDLPRPERVHQLNHPDLRSDFPPLRSATEAPASRLPVTLTTFVGRAGQVAGVREMLRDNRLVTLTGAGGIGKTRLAIRVAEDAAADFPGGVFFVDLAPVNEPAVVPVAVARSLDLTDQPGRSIMDTVARFLRDRTALLVLDNCEHLLDASGALADEILRASANLTVLATSREPIGIAGELIWRVPSLSLDGEAAELFIDRARRVRADVVVSTQQMHTVEEICRRLDGMPLAIELAAARTRTLSLAQILESLQQSFRVLTGGARTAMRRQQTLSASIDWSHSLLTDSERILFRRLAAFTGGFDLDGAAAVGADSEMERVQLVDVLGLLVDKSLIVAEESGDRMRYRLLETVRQYGQEKLVDSGEADAVRTRHRDYYAATAAAMQARIRGDGTPLVPWAETEIDNLRTAYIWSCDNADFGTALTLVSSLQRMWVTRGRFREGLAGFDRVFTDDRYSDSAVAPEVWVRAIADAGILAVWLSATADLPRAREALRAARQIGDPGLTARILMACGLLDWDHPEAAGPDLMEAIGLARMAGDQFALCEALGYLSCALAIAGLPGQAEAAGEEGRRLADLLGYRHMSRYCRMFLSSAIGMKGQLTEALSLAEDVVAESRAEGDRAMEAFGLINIGFIAMFSGDSALARAAGTAALEIGAAQGGFHEDSAYVVLACAALAEGDPAGALRACEIAVQHTHPHKELYLRGLTPMTQAALCCGDLVAARRWADGTVASVPGAYRSWGLAARARVAIAQGEAGQAERDVHDALTAAELASSYIFVPDALESLAALTALSNPRRAARLLGAASALCREQGQVRPVVFDADHEATVAIAREGLGSAAFDEAWAEGEALNVAEAIAYAQRGRGDRKRPDSGWESLTPAEHDVVRLLSEGLSNKEIGDRLFISPRTVQTHLTHIYGKLDLSSRVQLAQEATRHV